MEEGEEAEEGAETLLFHEVFPIVYEFCMNLYQSILQN